MSELIELENHPHLMPIALDIAETLPRELGYEGHSAYVMFHLSSDGKSVAWFDGVFGTIGNISVWHRWVSDRKVRMALRGIIFHQGITDSSFSLLFDLSTQALYVGELNRVRHLLMDLAQAQANTTTVGQLSMELNVDLEALDTATPEYLDRLFSRLQQGMRFINRTLH